MNGRIAPIDSSVEEQSLRDKDVDDDRQPYPLQIVIELRAALIHAASRHSQKLIYLSYFCLIVASHVFLGKEIFSHSLLCVYLFNVESNGNLLPF